MNDENLWYAWNLNYGLSIVAIFLVFLFWRISRFKFLRNNLLFFIALFLFLITDASPLHYLGMHKYFFAHMIVHVIILLICGPLLALSFVLPVNQPLPSPLHYVSRFLIGRPVLCWLAGVGIMWFWHIPAIFDDSFGEMGTSSAVALLHPLSMLLAGMIFAWPIFSPDRSKRLQPLVGVAYLFTACISCSLLGLLISFAPPGTYAHYAAMRGMFTVAPAISPEQDLQTAGLIMWVPCCLVYLTGCIILLHNYFSGKGSSETEFFEKSTATI